MTTLYLRFEPGGAPQRQPYLEQCLAAAQSSEVIDDWRSDAQQCLQLPDSPVLQAAPVAWFDATLTAPSTAPSMRGDGSVFLAQALRTEATLSSVRLPPDGLLHPTAAETAALAADFAALPATRDGLQPRLAAVGGQLFFCFDAPLDARVHDPASLLGFDLREFRPVGTGARRLMALCSEVEMWLFEHAINRARLVRGEPALTTLWPWGGGAPLTRLPTPAFGLQGDDVLFSAWLRRAPPSAAAEHRLIVCSQALAAPALDALLAPWLPALQAAMRRGRGALHLCAGRRRFTLRRMPRRWFARRGGPWWEYFDESD